MEDTFLLLVHSSTSGWVDYTSLPVFYETHDSLKSTKLLGCECHSMSCASIACDFHPLKSATK